MTDLLRRTPEMLQAPQTRSEVDLATGQLPLGTEGVPVEFAVDSSTDEPLIKDPDARRDITIFAANFRNEIDSLLAKGAGVSRGALHLAIHATNNLLQIDTQDEVTATENLRRAFRITEELTKHAPPADVVPEPTNRGIPLESTPLEDLPDPLTVVNALSSWHKQNPKAGAELRKSVEWTRDALNHSAPEARLRDGAFLVEVLKELEQNSSS